MTIKRSKFRNRGIRKGVNTIGITLLGTVALTGCLVEGDVSTSTNQATQPVDFNRVSNPTGRITGVVVDTNGNPVQNAIVSAAGQRVRTDAEGVYTLTGVTATNTVNTTNANNDGTNGGGADTGLPSIPVSIRPANSNPDEPALLGAIASVTPVAQLSSYTGSDGAGTCNAGATCSGGDSILTVFIDGFTASAGTAVLPRLVASAQGVLRDDQTGEAIANTRLTLDMIGLTNASGTTTVQQPDPGSANYSFQTFTYSATTDEQGQFVFENLPADSDLRVDVEGWNNPRVDIDRFGVASQDQIRTYDESNISSLGNVFVDRILSNDDVAPFFVNVFGVITPTQNSGQLNRDNDGTAGLVFPLSERIDADRVSAATVMAYDTDQEIYLGIDGVSVSADEKSIVVTMTSPLVAGNVVNFFFQKSDVLDLSENVLTEDNGDINYDSDLGNGYVRVSLEAFQEVTRPSGIAAASQVDDDPAGQEQHPMLNNTSDAFANSFNAVAGVQQLNSVNNDTGLVLDTQERLVALSNALLSEAAGVAGPVFNVDAARISFTPTDVEQYTIQVIDQQGITRDPSGLLVVAPTSSNLDLAGANFAADRVTLDLQDGHTGDAFFLLDGVEPGWMVRIRETDSLGNSGQPIEVTLADTVPPTTVLQNSYGSGPGTTGQIAVTYGDGGELAQSQQPQLGIPRLHVTPYLFAAQDGTVPPADQIGALDRLYVGKQVRPVDGELLESGVESYDATAFLDWPAQARTLGVAFSENIAVTGAPAYNGSVILDGYEANNDVTVNDQGSPVNVDLVNVNVADILGLSLDDGSLLDFAGAIQDEAGNSASAVTNARVAVTDRIPPFVSSANYTASGELTLNFNEPVSIAAGDAVGNSINGVFLCAEKPDAVAGATSVTYSGDELTDCSIGRPDLAALTVDTLDDGDANTIDPRFTRINFDAVSDANGNSWPFDGTLAPEFLVQLPPPFARAAAPQPQALPDAVNSFTVTYEFNHDLLDLTEFPIGANNASSLTGAEVDALFTFNDADAGGVDINSGASSASVTGTTLVVTVGLTGNTATGDSFDAPFFGSAIAAAIADPDLDPVDGTADEPTVP